MTAETKLTAAELDEEIAKQTRFKRSKKFLALSALDQWRFNKKNKATKHQRLELSETEPVVEKKVAEEVAKEVSPQPIETASEEAKPKKKTAKKKPKKKMWGKS